MAGVAQHGNARRRAVWRCKARRAQLVGARIGTDLSGDDVIIAAHLRGWLVRNSR